MESCIVSVHCDSPLNGSYRVGELVLSYYPVGSHLRLGLNALLVHLRDTPLGLILHRP